MFDWFWEPIMPVSIRYIQDRYPMDSAKYHYLRINYDPSMNEKDRTNPHESFTINNISMRTQWNGNHNATMAARRLVMEKIMMRPDWEAALKKHEEEKRKWLIIGSKYKLGGLLHLKKEVKLRYRDATTPWEYKTPREESWLEPHIRPIRDKTTKSFFDPPPTP